MPMVWNPKSSRMLDLWAVKLDDPQARYKLSIGWAMPPDRKTFLAEIMC